MRDDREVGRQRPRRGRPDHQREPLALEPRIELAAPRVVDQRQLDVDARRAVVLVLDLGLGERGAVARAPHDRLLAAVEVTAARELRQRAGDRALVARIERQVRVLPVAEHAEPLELAALDVDVAQRELAAQPADLRRRHRAAPLDDLRIALDRELDRQAVGIPARHVRRAEPRHRARLDDDVLQDLVEDVAVVDVAVGVRRAVVQHEQRCAGARLEDPVVQLDLVPPREDLGLAPGQVTAHRELGVREDHRILVFRLGLLARHQTATIADPTPAVRSPRRRAAVSFG